MDHSLHALCDTVKKILLQLKPQANPLSFIIITGTQTQGKSTLLKQSTMEELPVFSEHDAKVYFNTKGIMVELGERWLTNSTSLLFTVLKQLNKCHRRLKITGIILCVDVNELLQNDTASFEERKKPHLHLLTRLGSNLGYPVELALLFTKMDALAGFSEFYQGDHVSDLVKPLGFSLDCVNTPAKKVETYLEQFNQLVEQQGQKVIGKLHPVRSTIKRSLIREFPLQLASLRVPIQTLIQTISPQFFNLQAIYFTSAEQGGMSIDRLNKKIQQEYALVVQDTFPQAKNFKAYFVEGALKTFQQQCSQLPQRRIFSQKPVIALTATFAGVSLLFLSHHYYKTLHLLDEASKELLAYDLLNNGKSTPEALYHLANAANKIDYISTNSVSLPTVSQLKKGLRTTTAHKVDEEFIPSLTHELEQAISSTDNTPITRYNALKIYLMLSEPPHFSFNEVYSWFKEHWQQQAPTTYKKRAKLLKNTLQQRSLKWPIQEQLISEARNYLNALPPNYLCYSLAKRYFSPQKEKINLVGFTLPTYEIPIYFTKVGFETTLNNLNEINNKLQAENWVLARQDFLPLNDILLQAYCFDYVTWWQIFMRKAQPIHYNDYSQGKEIAHQIEKSNAFYQLITLIQHETKPELTANNSLFNRLIASKFTELNLISLSVIKELNLKIYDLEQFISTLAVINDEGRTAFTLTKSRFLNEHAADPLSLLYAQAQQLPEPLRTWINQLAGDTWALLIQESRLYINQQWEKTVFAEFKSTIANRYPLAAQKKEIAIADFNHFFSTHGTFNTFTEQYLKPFLDVSKAQWQNKAINDFIMPISPDSLDEIIRANIITNMFFPNDKEESKIDFSLQKISLDPMVSNLHITLGANTLMDNQSTESLIRFNWPQTDAKLTINSIEGNHYELAEQGQWAIFKLLEKVNVLVDEQDSSSLQILFEVNGNSGRYLLKTTNQINPFTPGILNGFNLNKVIV